MPRSDALEQLRDLDYQERRRRYPSAPEHAIPRRKFSDRTANALTTCVIRWLQLHGYKAWRQGSEGRYRPGATITDVVGRQRRLKGTWLPGQNNGAADVCCIINGRFVAVEVKMKDKQSEAQRRYQEEVEQSGGIYFIARDFESFAEWYSHFINTISQQS